MNKTKKTSGVLGGLILLVVGIGILWNNEGRAVKTQSAINEAKKTFIQVKSDKVDSKNEGKLIATKGKIDETSLDDLKDDIFAITTKAVKLKRNVEMYQWSEECTEEDEKTKCTYEKVWESDLLDSSEYKEAGHDNPSDIPYESEEYYSDDVKMGAFIIPEELVKQLKYDKKVNNEKLVEQYNNTKENIKVDGKYLTNVKEDGPQIGDIRISYLYTNAKNVSVMGVQTDDTFEAFTSKKGKDIYTIVEGNKTGTQILESMTKANKNIKWFLRILGVAFIIGAFSSMFNFITTLANKVPILGNIVSGATSIVSIVLGLGLALLIIAIAWFRFRPILSIVLIVIVIALIVLLRMYQPKKDSK
ncbi:MAG: TMEM43 family protein [Bacilli bacterium]|nr:TMEM43 family protein [Bacilli bacterium]